MAYIVMAYIVMALYMPSTYLHMQSRMAINAFIVMALYSYGSSTVKDVHERQSFRAACGAQKRAMCAITTCAITAQATMIPARAAHRRNALAEAVVLSTRRAYTRAIGMPSAMAEGFFVKRDDRGAQPGA